ncbi:sigma factor-like helix-turn-helix DNA-binding protein [Hyphomonas sp.]|uniref:sigma factor-like helix-turn-helix DNA-binding protein n=1 Tax=Hyphomonas sp. TaxID=87 RepID=UPI003527E362
MDRLRRYAVLASGSLSAGDNVVGSAIETFLSQEVPSGAPDVEILFGHVDKELRSLNGSAAGAFSGFGRWKLLDPLERRLVLLVSMEGFSCKEAGRICETPVSQVKARLARAQMRYADRFPARVGLVGANEMMREKVGLFLKREGHSVLWSIGEREDLTDARLGLPNIVVLIGRSDETEASSCRGRMKSGCSHLPALREHLGPAFAGPVIVARSEASGDRTDDRVWEVPVADLCDADNFRRTLYKALLFSA